MYTSTNTSTNLNTETNEFTIPNTNVSNHAETHEYTHKTTPPAMNTNINAGQNANKSININKNKRLSITDTVYIAMGATLIAVCSWISIPTAVPFTLQTFAIFAVLELIGGKRGTYSILIYILLGICNIPVFSGFRAGIGTLLGATGGYIMGFILTGFIYTLFTCFLGNKIYIRIVAMIIGLFTCYAFGTMWFMFVYTKNTGEIELSRALSLCVIPFLPFDAIKTALAVIISKYCKRFVK